MPRTGPCGQTDGQAESGDGRRRCHRRRSREDVIEAELEGDHQPGRPRLEFPCVGIFEDASGILDETEDVNDEGLEGEDLEWLPY